MWFQLANKVSALKYQVREMHNEKERILKEMDELKMKIENLSFKGLATVIIILLFIAKILTIIADLLLTAFF